MPEPEPNVLYATPLPDEKWFGATTLRRTAAGEVDADPMQPFFVSSKGRYVCAAASRYFILASGSLYVESREVREVHVEVASEPTLHGAFCAAFAKCASAIGTPPVPFVVEKPTIDKWVEILTLLPHAMENGAAIDRLVKDQFSDDGACATLQSLVEQNDRWIIAPVASGNEFENYLRKNLMGTGRRDGGEAEGAARWGQALSVVGDRS